MASGDRTRPDGASVETVRPFGFASDQPVVRQVGGRNLYLGNVHAATATDHGHEFDHVVSATVDEQPSTTHHCPLADGPGNDWETFAAAVDATRRYYEADGSTLVHCRAGVSRSATLIATALAAEENRSFADALDEIHETRPIATPHPALRTDAAIYLAARS